MEARELHIPGLETTVEMTSGGTDKSAKCQRWKRKGRNRVWLLATAQKLWLNKDMFPV